MPFSNYPGGFAQGVTIRGMPVLSSYPGTVFWVDSVNGSNGNSGTFDRPFSTIDYAVGRCTASRGDIICAKAGHVETVTAAAGVAMDVAGVATVTDPITGLSVRARMFYDGNTATNFVALDALYGTQVLNGQLATQVKRATSVYPS